MLQSMGSQRVSHYLATKNQQGVRAKLAEIYFSLLMISLREDTLSS